MHEPSKKSIIPNFQVFIDTNNTETPTTPMYSDGPMVEIGNHPTQHSLSWHSDDVLQPLCHPIQQQTCLGLGSAVPRTSLCQLGQDQLYSSQSAAVRHTSSDQHHADHLELLDSGKLQNQHLHQVASQLDLPNYQQAAITLYKLCHQLPMDAQVTLYHQVLELILDLPAPWLQNWVKTGYKYFFDKLLFHSVITSYHVKWELGKIKKSCIVLVRGYLSWQEELPDILFGMTIWVGREIVLVFCTEGELFVWSIGTGTSGKLLGTTLFSWMTLTYDPL